MAQTRSVRRSGSVLILSLMSTALGSPSPCAAKSLSVSQPLFTDISTAAGLKFVHFNGMSGAYQFPEITGQGGAVFDYDNDGDLDIYLVQGSMLGKGNTIGDALLSPADPNPRDRLFRNDLAIDDRGKRTIHFEDVTDRAGIRSTGYGIGAAAGDVNNDGWIDLYVSNYGENRMLMNNGDGTFRDTTAESGTGDKLWGASSSFFDYDKDGWLDLYVTNYVDFDVNKAKRCFSNASRRDYCGPSSFSPQTDRLFRNKGRGVFEDVTNKALANNKPHAGMGVITTDVNGDGWTDIYVANDGQVNQLWINQGGKTFRDNALFSGTALNTDGRAEASMGVGAADFDADGDEDLFITHLMGETNTLYVNDGHGLFEDRTLALGLSAASFPFTAFGASWIDYDNDGWSDLFVVNGAVRIIESQQLAGDEYPLRQPNQVFRNEGGRRFADVTAIAGKDIALSEVSRGAASGDMDNDGDVDVVVFNNNGPVRLYRNNVGNQNRWLGIRLMDAETRRDLLGTRVALEREGKATMWRWVCSGGSYCSASDPRVLFGLGDSDVVDRIRVYWPDGTQETWHDPVLGKYTTLEKGAVNPVSGTRGPTSK